MFQKLSLLILLEIHLFIEQYCLLYPRGNPTRFQFIAGFGIPLDLDEYSVTFGVVFKAQYFLPHNVTQLYPNDFIERRFRNKRNTIEFKSIFSDDQDVVPNLQNQSYIETNLIDKDIWKNTNKEKLMVSRWILYDNLIEIIASRGYAGRECLLRMICESSGTMFDKKLTLFGDIFHIILSPSITKEKIRNHKDNEYFYAETQGKLGAPCNYIFKKCQVSIIEFLTM